MIRNKNGENTHTPQERREGKTGSKHFTDENGDLERLHQRRAKRREDASSSAERAVGLALGFIFTIATRVEHALWTKPSNIKESYTFTH